MATIKIKVERAGTQINTDNKGTKKTHDYSLEVLGIEFKGIKGNKPNGNWRVQDILEHRKKENG